MGKPQYIDAMHRSSACAVQTFDVAFSRRMCWFTRLQ